MQYYNRKSDILVTDSEVEIVALSEIKTALKIDSNDEDDLLRGYIKAARQKAEAYTGRAFITQTRKLTMDGFGKQSDLPIGFYQIPKEYFTQSGDYVEVPVKPLQSVTSLNTYATDNSSSTFNSSNYTLDTASGRIYLDIGATWPSNLRNRNAVEVTYKAGYGDNPDDVPEAIRQALMMLTAQYYESRGMCEISCACKSLLDPYRILDNNWLC